MISARYGLFFLAALFLIPACATGDQWPHRDEAARTDRVQRASPPANPSAGQRQAAPQVYSVPKRQAVEKPPRQPQLYPGSGAVLGALEPARTAPGGGELEPVMLNFIDTELGEVVAVVLGELLQVNYTIEPGLTGEVTLQTSEPIPRESVLTTLDVLLNLNGAAIVQTGSLYKVVSLANARRAGVPVRTKLRAGFSGFGYRVQVVPLNFVPVSEMSKVLQSLSLGENVLHADPQRNVLMLAGSEPELRSLNDAIEIFDVDWLAGMSFGLFPIKFAEAPTIIAELEALFQQGGGEAQQSLVQFVPIERLNSILVVTRQARYLQRARLWIERLDQKGDGTSRQIYVYRVQNARAEALATALTEIFQSDEETERRRTATTGGVAPGLTPAQVGAIPLADGSDLPQPDAIVEDRPVLNAADRSGSDRGGSDGIALLGGSSVRVIADTDQNALIILATPQEYELVEATLKKLDVLPLQVLIQAAIFEVRLTDDLNYGIRWFFERGGHQLEIDSLPAAAGAFSYAFSSTNFAAAVEALSSITDVKTLSSPELMVLDNQTATLQVGDQVPVTTRQAQSVTDPDAPIVNSITFRDTGVILRVTPRVNAGGLVTMQIEQEVSNVAASEEPTVTPTIFQRTISSTIAVTSGESVALGGLISENQRTSRRGVPLLSDVPLLGALFRTNGWETERTELLVLITPRVVRNQAEANLVTGEIRDRMKKVRGHIQNMEDSGKWAPPKPMGGDFPVSPQSSEAIGNERPAPEAPVEAFAGPEASEPQVLPRQTPETLTENPPTRTPVLAKPLVEPQAAQVQPQAPQVQPQIAQVQPQAQQITPQRPRVKPPAPRPIAQAPRAKAETPQVQSVDQGTSAALPAKAAGEPGPEESVDATSKTATSAQDGTAEAASLQQPAQQEPSQQQPVVLRVTETPETAGVLPGSRLAFYLHLASYRSAIEVEWGWEDLLVTYPDMLGGLDLETTRVDLGSRGIFYRLSAGPLLDKLRADRICRELANLNQFCEVRIGLKGES